MLPTILLKFTVMIQREKEGGNEREKNRETEFMSLMKGYVFCCYSTIKEHIWNNSLDLPTTVHGGETAHSDSFSAPVAGLAYWRALSAPRF